MKQEIFRTTNYYNLYYFVNENNVNVGVFKAYDFDGILISEDIYKPIDKLQSLLHNVCQDYNIGKGEKSLYTLKME